MSFPSLPTSVDRYVRETLNRMLGRSGKAGEQVVLQSDLVELGLATANGSALGQPVTPNTSISNTLKPVAVGGTPLVGQTIPDNPTTPEGLSAAGTFGAVILQWTPPVYKGHNHTEIWRAQIDDREQASQVHEANGSRYADVIGSATEHYYWIRHVNDAGQTSGFNQLPGVLGSPTASIDVESLVLDHPQIREQPFTVINLGTDESPNYVIALNADIALNGQLNINQLQSGELQNGTALTIGQGSIELGTASDGYGQLVITGQGGIATNDYLLIKEGRIESFVYTASAGHVRYKEVRRNESGTANSGQSVTIPAYFKTQPSIHLYPRDISIYNADYSSQSQRMEIYNSVPYPHAFIEGAWVFTPYAQLVLADGSVTEAVNWQLAGSTNSQTWSSSELNNLNGVTIYAQCGSYRRSSGATYQNRQVTVYLEYRPSGSSSWSLGASSVVNVSQFTVHSLSLSKSFALGSYAVRVRFVAADRSGTFTSGSVSYETTSEGKSGSNWSKTLEPIGYQQTYKSYVTIGSYTMSGWEITRIDYTATFNVTLKVRNVSSDNNSSGSLKRGTARVKIPNGSGGVSTYEKTSTSSYTNDPWEEQSDSYTRSWSDSSYKDGKMRGQCELFASTGGYTSASSNASTRSAALAYLSVSNVSATVYYRRAVSNPFTYNTYHMDSARYDKGATNISLSNAVITWTASGE